MKIRLGLAAALLPAALLQAVPAWADSAPAADPLPRAAPEAVGLSSERLGRIGNALRDEIERRRLPGAVVAIARKGKLAYFEAFGARDPETGAPMTTDALFSIASMTKPMTTVGALTLYEEGRLLLSDPLGRYLPVLAKMPVAVQPFRTLNDGKVETRAPVRPPTVQDLMRHTSGLVYGARGSTPVHEQYPPSSARSATSMTAQEFLDRLGSLPLLHQPGTVWEYSLSTDVLGLTVEAVAGRSLGSFLQERLWGPLGMRDTGFVLPPEAVGRWARAFPNNPDTGRPQTILDVSKAPKFECGGGCAYSSAGDYIRFAEMLLEKGRLGDVRILGRKTVEYMTADHLGPEVENGIATTESARDGYGFGLGVAVRRTAGVSGVTGSKGDYNWGGAYGTYFWVDPEEELAVVFMAHAPGSIRTHTRALMKTLVLQAVVD